HYNLQALVKANLVVAEEFHYSEKGKEVLHYSLANKLIIIAQRKTSVESFKERLKGLLPVGLIALAAGGVIQLVSMFRSGLFAAGAKLGGEQSLMMAKSAAPVLDEAAPRMMAAAPEAFGGAASNIQYVTQPSIAAWFLLGAAFTVVLLIIWYYFVTRKNAKE
ncbi:MAG: hypothetical protein V1866_03500, partial [archaeon]